MKFTPALKELATKTWKEVSSSTSIGESIMLKYAQALIGSLPEPKPLSLAQEELELIAGIVKEYTCSGQKLSDVVAGIVDVHKEDVVSISTFLKELNDMVKELAKAKAKIEDLTEEVSGINKYAERGIKILKLASTRTVELFRYEGGAYVIFSEIIDNDGVGLPVRGEGSTPEEAVDNCMVTI